MTSVLMVDWLGRGGIAQCTAAWDVELRAQGIGVVTVSRASRELVGEKVLTASGPGRVRAHAAVSSLARSVILDMRPDTVVFHNWVIPTVERPAHDAARRVGAKVVVVVHDHRMHSLAGGVRLGLAGLLRRADAVVVHTNFVQREIVRFAKCNVELVPHPVQVGMLSQPRPPQRVFDEHHLVGLHFGVLKRSYKGTDVVLALAEHPPPGWRFAMVGIGAPRATANLTSIDRFLGAAELCAMVEQSAATVLPYRFATQSGAVVLAQACGSVPVATAVGGIVEQIDDRESGRLLPAGAGIEEWRRVLSEIADTGERKRLAETAKRAVWAQHRRFVEAATELVV